MDKEKKLNEELLDKVSGGGEMKFQAPCPCCGYPYSLVDNFTYNHQKYSCSCCHAEWVNDMDGHTTIISEGYDDPVEAVENMLKLKESVIKKFGGK